jgi:electron transport complex protein RnfG
MNTTQAQEHMPLGRLKDYNIVQAWLVLLLAILFGGALAGVQITLSPTIEANKINETRQKVPELVLGAEAARRLAEQGPALTVDPLFLSVEGAGKKTTYNVFEARKTDGELAGWVVKAGGQGYADKIELLVGLGPLAKNIKGLFILDQKETPGLGNKVVTPEWRSQFIEKATDQPLVVVKGGVKAENEIDAVTGATISSRAVTNIVNTAVTDLQEQLAAIAAEGK